MWQKVESWVIWILIKVRLFVSLQKKKKKKKGRLFVKKSKEKNRGKKDSKPSASTAPIALMGRF